MSCTGATFAHRIPYGWPQRIGLIDRVSRLYDMNENVFAFFSCMLDDGWLRLCNIELISIPRRDILA
uniref:Uncharacterized protein n=1 Tax=Oryza punctata TaxID=4537 RepID=A0A0E0M607_ORYPU